VAAVVAVAVSGPAAVDGKMGVHIGVSLGDV
jgi:hypothetical protein